MLHIGWPGCSEQVPQCPYRAEPGGRTTWREGRDRTHLPRLDFHFKKIRRTTSTIFLARKVRESHCFKQVWRLRKKFNRSLSIAQKRYAVAIHVCRGGRGLQLLPVVLGLVRAVRRRPLTPATPLESGSFRVLHMLSEKFGPEPPAPTQNQPGNKSEAKRQPRGCG